MRISIWAKSYHPFLFQNKTKQNKRLVLPACLFFFFLSFCLLSFGWRTWLVEGRIVCSPPFVVSVYCSFDSVNEPLRSSRCGEKGFDLLCVLVVRPVVCLTLFFQWVLLLFFFWFRGCVARGCVEGKGKERGWPFRTHRGNWKVEEKLYTLKGKKRKRVQKNGPCGSGWKKKEFGRHD